jgi:hypothetical protein
MNYDLLIKVIDKKGINAMHGAVQLGEQNKADKIQEKELLAGVEAVKAKEKGSGARCKRSTSTLAVIHWL